MAFCSNCGKELNENVKFCENCGTGVKSVTTSQNAGLEKPYTVAKKQNHSALIVKLVILAVVLVILFPVIRDMGKSELEQNIKSWFQSTMRQDDTYGEIWKENNIEVKQVTLVRKTWSTYDGIVEVSVKGKTYNVSIEVTKDGSSAMWKTTQPKLMAFGFLGELYLKKMQEESERQLEEYYNSNQYFGW